MPEALVPEVKRARSGDAKAREALARRALTLSLRTAFAATGNRELANDIAQEVSIVVLRRLWRLRKPESFDAWVHRITVRQTVHTLRREKRRATNEVTLDEGLNEVLSTDKCVQTATIDRVGANQALAGALDGLPTNQRVALALRYVHDLSEQQIATAMRTRPGTVGAHLSRARNALRQHPDVHSYQLCREGV